MKKAQTNRRVQLYRTDGGKHHCRSETLFIKQIHAAAHCAQCACGIYRNYEIHLNRIYRINCKPIAHSRNYAHIRN